MAVITLDISEIIASILIVIIGTTITFYIKDVLIRRKERIRLKDRLRKTIGIGKFVIYVDSEKEADKYEVKNIDDDGIVLVNETQTVFVPNKKIIENEIIIPSEHYEENRMKKSLEKMSKPFIKEFINELRQIDSSNACNQKFQHLEGRLKKLEDIK